jgi:arabinose-5-phosphate isomerase
MAPTKKKPVARPVPQSRAASRVTAAKNARPAGKPARGASVRVSRPPAGGGGSTGAAAKRVSAPSGKPAGQARPQAKPAKAQPRNAGPLDPVAIGREVIAIEAKAVRALADRLGPSFAEAVRAVLACRGRVVVTGMGKPGFIAQKISATLASTGTPSLYLHPAEALHGDLGRVVRDDLLLALSNSGRTEEVVRMLRPVKRIGAKVIAATGDPESPLAREADLVLDVGNNAEAGPLGLAPTTSSTVLLALGDALAMAVLRHRDFGNDEYALFHPGGSLGRSVMRVSEVMRKGEENPLVAVTATVAEAVRVMTRTPGRPGATSVVDGDGRLVGIFTDGDLRRLLERGDYSRELLVEAVMGRNPRTIRPDLLVLEAARILGEAKVDQVPVVDEAGRPVGLLDVQDLLAARLIA